MAVFDTTRNNSSNNISNDITVRCRVRRTIPIEEVRDPIPNHSQHDNPINNHNDRHKSGSNPTPSTTPFIEMTCTMRNWDKQYPNRSSSEVRMRSASCDTRNEQQLQQQQSSISSLFRNSLLMTKSDTVTTLNAAGNNATNLCNEGPELYFIPIVYPSCSDTSPCKSSRLLHVSRRISPSAKAIIKSSSVSSLAQSPKSSSMFLQESNEVEPFSIPMEEILHVTIYDNTAKRQRSATRKAYTIEVTTYTFAIYEIDCMTMNGYDILYACINTKLGSSSSSSSHHQKIRIIEPDTKKYKLKKNDSNRTSPASAKIRSKTTASSAPSSSLHDNDDQRTVDSTSVTTANDNSTTTSTNNSASNIGNGQSGGASNVRSSSRANLSNSNDIMDTLETQQFATIAQSETIYDKLLRKYQYIVTNLSEQWHNNAGTSTRNSSDTMNTRIDQYQSPCCCDHNPTSTTKSTSTVASTDPRRSNTSSNGFDFLCCSGVEFESFCGNDEEIIDNTPSITNADATATATTNRNYLGQQQHPSSRSSRLSPLVLPKHNSSHNISNRIQQSIGSHQNHIKYNRHHHHHHHHHHHAVNSSYDTTNTISTNSSRIITHMPSGLSVEAPDQESLR